MRGTVRVPSNAARLGRVGPGSASGPPANRANSGHVLLLDASIIDLGLSLCPRARFDCERAAVKLHAQLDLRGPLPAAVQITPATTQEVTWLDTLAYEPGAFYLMDRGYVDYGRLHAIERARAWYVSNLTRHGECNGDAIRPTMAVR